MGNGSVLPEMVNEKLLKAFYENVKGMAFPFQLYMLATRLYQLDLAEKYDEKSLLVLDRGVVGDTIFASLHHKQGNISDQEFDLYQSVCQQRMPRQLSDRVDVLIYLDVSPQTCLERVEKRARSAEEKLPLDYLEQLDMSYFTLLVEWLGGRAGKGMNIASRAPPLLVLPWETYGSVEAVAEKMKAFCHATDARHPTVTFGTEQPTSGTLTYSDEKDTDKGYAQLCLGTLPKEATTVALCWTQKHSNAFRRLVMYYLSTSSDVHFWSSV